MIRRDPTVIRIRPNDVSDMQQLIAERKAAKLQGPELLEKQQLSLAVHVQDLPGPAQHTSTPAPAAPPPAPHPAQAPPDIVALDEERRRRQAMSTAQRLGIDQQRRQG